MVDIKPTPARLPNNPRLVVVVPTYNERENLPILAQQLFGLGIAGLRLLVVDDGSPDGTGQLAETLSAQYDGHIHVLHRTHKQGLGPAYLAGFSHAMQQMDAQLIVQMDADLSHQPHYLPQMLAEIQQHDLVIGSRFQTGGSVDANWGFLRRLMSLWANRVYTPAILRLPVCDATGGFKMWRSSTLQGMPLKLVHSGGYVFQVEMTYMAFRLGYRITEIPIHFPDRQYGTSKMSPNVALEAAMRVWQILYRHRALKPASRRQTSAS